MARPALTAEDERMLNEAAREGLFSKTFTGKRVSLTGTMSMSRADIVRVIQAAGGRYEVKPVRGTNYLVVGDTKANGMTSKIRAALALDIEVLEEHEFAAMLSVVDLT